MFKTIIFTIFGLLLYSCDTDHYPKYRYEVNREIPDSLADDYALWVTQTVSASNFHMTGGDYEDPEDVVEQIEETGRVIFSRDVEGLGLSQCSSCGYRFMAADKLTGRQLEIFKELKNTSKNN